MGISFKIPGIWSPNDTLLPGVSKAHFSDYGGRRWEGLENRLESRERLILWMEQWVANKALRRQIPKPHLTERAWDREGMPGVESWNEHNPGSHQAHSDSHGNTVAAGPPMPGQAFKQWAPCLCEWVLGDRHRYEPHRLAEEGGNISVRAHNHLNEESFKIQKEVENKTVFGEKKHKF